jgi:hypothetical protein
MRLPVSIPRFFRIPACRSGLAVPGFAVPGFTVPGFAVPGFAVLGLPFGVFAGF